MVKLICAVVVVAACGGGNKPATTPVTTGSGPDENEPQTVGDANMVSAEKMDEITRLLERKQRIVSRCLADAVDAKELPKNARGKVTLDIVIAPSGKTQKVAVIKSTLESERLKSCVIGHVTAIQFPELPKPYPTSYTYAFEAL